MDEMVPNLVTARAILDSVREGRIDVGPLDAYWHLLIAKHNPTLTAGVRVLDSTEVATLPAFVTAASTPAVHHRCAAQCVCERLPAPVVQGILRTRC